MRVIVTGGRGQVGGAIRRQLSSPGWEIFDVSRLGMIRADLSSPDFAEQVAGVVKRCDAIVHCAASMAKGLIDREVSQVNGAGTQAVIRLAALTRASQLIYLSSVPVIGQPQHGPIDEEHPTHPLTAYHASKLFGEQLVRLATSPSLRTASLRLTSPIGAGTPPGRIFSEFIARARRSEALVLAGQGGRRQNYVDVRDIAQAVAQCLKSKAAGVFNVAGNGPVSNLELARRCIAVLNSASPLTFSGAADAEEDVVWDVSIEKARRTFGYQPVHSLEDSIQAFVSAHESSHPQ